MLKMFEILEIYQHLMDVLGCVMQAVGGGGIGKGILKAKEIRLAELFFKCIFNST